MAGIDYPRYLQTLDLLNIMIAILVYDGCKLYKYGYFFPKKVEITKVEKCKVNIKKLKFPRVEVMQNEAGPSNNTRPDNRMGVSSDLNRQVR
jgi:hypothetical protein